MGLYFDGQKMSQPYFNGIKINGYFNGSKIWVSDSKNPLALLTEVSDDILTENGDLILTEQVLDPIPGIIIPEGTSIITDATIS